MRGYREPQIRIVCPRCNWVTSRAYKEDGGFGVCKLCGALMKRAYASHEKRNAKAKADLRSFDPEV